MCTSTPTDRAYSMAAISVAIMADIPADLAPSIICLAVEISLSYRIVLTVRYVLTPASRHSAAMAARSSIVKLTPRENACSAPVCRNTRRLLLPIWLRVGIRSFLPEPLFQSRCVGALLSVCCVVLCPLDCLLSLTTLMSPLSLYCLPSAPSARIT